MASHRHHKHLHRRAPEPNVWDDFTKGVAELNPFKETTKTLVEKGNGPSTVYQTVYTTMQPTFTGAIGGYSTVGSDNDDQTSATTPTSDAKSKATTSANADSDDTTLPESVVPTTTANLSTESSLAMATSHSTTSSEGAVATGATASTAIAAAASSTSTASTSSDSSSSDNSGVKAGIAFGVLGGLLLIGLLAWFLFNKRRKQMEQQRAIENEKSSGAMAAAAALDRRSSVQTTRTTATAPRLSLRPITQFMPNFGERRSSKGAAIALGMASTSKESQSSRSVGNSAWERPSTSQSNHHDNPFGNNAERLDTVSERSVPAPGPDSHPSNPFNAPENVVGVAQTTDSPPEPSPLATAAAAAGAGAAAGMALTRKQSTRKDAPQTLDLTKAGNAVRALGPVPPIPASPAGTEFSMTEVDPGQSPGPSNSAAAIAAAGGPAQSAVHRVQLDFNPTMDDEIELKAGQLVRMLHEYDDGWVSTSLVPILGYTANCS